MIPDYYLSAADEPTMLAALTACGMASGGSFITAGKTGQTSWMLNVIGNLYEFVPGAEYENTEPAVQVDPNSTTPLFWVAVSWTGQNPIPSAWSTLSVYNADGSAVTPPYDPTPDP